MEIKLDPSFARQPHEPEPTNAASRSQHAGAAAPGSTAITLPTGVPPKATGNVIELKPALTQAESDQLGQLQRLAVLRQAQFADNPQAPSEAVFLSGLLASLGRSDQGAQVMHWCTARHGHYAPAQRELARCLYEQGHVDQAAAAANKALTVSKSEDEQRLAQKLLQQFRDGSYSPRKEALAQNILDQVTLTYELPAAAAGPARTLSRFASFLRGNS